MKPIHPDFSSTIREVPRQLALGQEDLARELGVSYATVNRWENSQARPSMLAMNEEVVENLSEDELSAWQFVALKDSINSRDLMEKLEFDERKAQRVLKKLIGVNLVRRVGKGPATRYEVVWL